MEYSSACPWNRYKIEFRYTSIYSTSIYNTKVVNEIEVEIAANAQEAVDMVRRDYADMRNVCIDNVYIDTGFAWDVVDNWN